MGSIPEFLISKLIPPLMNRSGIRQCMKLGVEVRRIAGNHAVTGRWLK